MFAFAYKCRPIGISLALVKSIIFPKEKQFCYFLTPAKLMTDCRSAVIAVTISYPRSLIACRHRIHGDDSPAIPYPHCRFADIYGAAKKYARALCGKRPTGILMSRALSLSLSLSLAFPPSLYGENLTFKLITQLLCLSCRKTRNSRRFSSPLSSSAASHLKISLGLGVLHFFSTLIQTPALLASR